jgi:hypothetical protein
MDFFAVLETLRREWQVIIRAPWTFIVLVVVVATCAWSFRDKWDYIAKTAKSRTIAIQQIVGIQQTNLEKPELRLSLTRGNAFTPSTFSTHHSLTGVALNVKVWNTGVPSAATDWKLEVIPQGESPVQGQLSVIPEQLRVGGWFNSTVIHASDSLDEKIKSGPISSTPVDGTLLFYVHLKKKVIVDPNTKLELSVKDAYGNESAVASTMGNWL